ncbi:MAG: hypothetical protein K2Z81_11830 [Cyanobacteria bacterium]|nr:hypothetical protein [Cyanobacteriota bacterium]
MISMPELVHVTVYFVHLDTFFFITTMRESTFRNLYLRATKRIYQLRAAIRGKSPPTANCSVTGALPQLGAKLEDVVVRVFPTLALDFEEHTRGELATLFPVRVSDINLALAVFLEQQGRAAEATPLHRENLQHGKDSESEHHSLNLQSSANGRLLETEVSFYTREIG